MRQPSEPTTAREASPPSPLHLTSGPRRPPAVPTGDGSDALRETAARLRERIVDSGRPLGVATGQLRTHPYPTAFALGEVPRSPAAWVSLTERMLVVQWRDEDEVTRTLLWEPRDHERSPFLPEAFLGRRRAPLRTVAHGTVPGHLRALGIAPEDVDYVAFSSLQNQDLRRLLGTTGPATDLGSPRGPVGGWLPAARLLVARAEWAALAHLHPLQRPWYQATTFADLPAERVEPVDADALVGPGIALVATPGRTSGHMSLVLNTDSGVWVCSSNGVAAEAWAPRTSRIPGLRSWAVAWDRAMVPHTNDPVAAAPQYDAMVLERELADRGATAPFPLCLPAAELARHRLSPGIAPTHVHGGIEHGVVRGSPLGRGH